MPDQDDKGSKFEFEEYRSLRTELTNTLKEYGDLEKLAIGACAGVYAWLAKSETPVIWAAWWVPAFIAALAGLRAIGLYRRICELGRYLHSLESHFYDAREPGEPAGWEHFRDKHDDVKRSMISRSAFVLWTILQVITVVVALVATVHVDAQVIRLVISY